MTIRAGFVLDFNTTYTLEEECEYIIEELELMGLSDIEVVFRDHVLDEGKKVDLLIIDYGGADIHGSSALAAATVRGVCHYAEEHPSCFVVIWTTFTKRIYEHELEEEFGHVDNIFMRFAGDTLFPKMASEGPNADPEFVKKIRAWFAM